MCEDMGVGGTLAQAYRDLWAWERTRPAASLRPSRRRWWPWSVPDGRGWCGCATGPMGAAAGGCSGATRCGRRCRSCSWARGAATSWVLSLCYPKSLGRFYSIWASWVLLRVVSSCPASGALFHPGAARQAGPAWGSSPATTTTTSARRGRRSWWCRSWQMGSHASGGGPAGGVGRAWARRRGRGLLCSCLGGRGSGGLGGDCGVRLAACQLTIPHVGRGMAARGSAGQSRLPDRPAT